MFYKEQILIDISNTQAVSAKDAEQTDCSTSNETSVKFISSVESVLPVFSLKNICD